MSDEEPNRYGLCVTCGRLKHVDLFNEGDCTCHDCYEANDSKIRFVEADDGEGFIEAEDYQ